MALRHFGVSIMSFRRAEYLKQMLDHLEQNDMDDVDVHLFQDGRFCYITGEEKATEEEVEKSREVFTQSSLKYKFIHQSQANLNCALQRRRIMPFMSDNYRSFVCMDNDIITCPTAIRDMRTLLERVEDDEKVGSVSAGFFFLADGIEKVEEYWDTYTYSTGHFWMEGWVSEKLNGMWPLYEEYCDRLKAKQMPYRKALGDGGVKNDISDWNRTLGVRDEFRGPSSDTALARMLLASGYERARFVVNRATGIGEYGMNSKPKNFAKLKGGFNPLYVFPDRTIKEFRFVEPYSWEEKENE